MQDGDNRGDASAGFQTANFNQASTFPNNTNSYKDSPNSVQSQSTTSVQPDDLVSWTATESNSKNRGKNWNLITAAVVVGIATLAIILFLVNFFDLFSLITLLILLILVYTALMISARQPARQGQYSLSYDSISINGQRTPLTDFRAFGVRRQGSDWMLVLIPAKRFAFEVTTVIDETKGEQIVDILSQQLPMEDIPESGLDSIIKRLKL